MGARRLFSSKKHALLLKWTAVCLGMALSYQNCSRNYAINGVDDLASKDPILQGCEASPCDNPGPGNGGDPGSGGTNNNAAGTIVINDGSEFTNKSDLSVNLTLKSPSAKEMYVTNDPTCKAGGEWEPFQQSKSWKLKSGNSEQMVYARFRETPQDTNPGCTSDAIIHDDEAPVLQILKNAPKYTNKPEVEIEVIGTDKLSGIDFYICLDAKGKSVGKCNPSLKLDQLPEGPGVMGIAVVDKAGNTSVPEIQSWVVDLTPPTVMINSAPVALGSTKLANISYSGSDNLSSNLQYQCQLDGGVYTACTSPSQYQVNDGPHNFSVKSFDEAGNASQPASVTWTVDSSAPTVRITSMPPVFSKTADSDFSFDGTDGGQPISKFECSVDGGAYQNCNSPKKIPALGEGNHQFSVRGIDSAGNTSAPAQYAWNIDLTLPMVQILSGPPLNTMLTMAAFTFVATDNTGIASIQCSLDGSAYANCSSPASIQNLLEGSHRFAVIAKDKAGNASNPAYYDWVVDQTPPTVSILTKPDKMSGDSAAKFILQVQDNLSGVSKIRCRLDSAANSDCNLTVNYANLNEGSHTFYVSAIDLAGNSSSEISYSWTIDLSGPSIVFTQIPLQTIGQTDSAVVEYMVTDIHAGVDTVKCGFEGSETSCPQAKLETFFNQTPNVTYVYSVIAKDKLGHESRNSVSWTVQVNTMIVAQDVQVRAYNKADVLFVIDNSGSMAYEQQSMANRFSTFIDSIKDLDWQIGIVTTDLDNDAALKDGRFVQYKTTGYPLIPANTFILNSTMDKASAKAVFGATIQRPSNEGSGSEQGIGATYRSIQRYLDKTTTVNTPNWNFFRDGASLSVVLVSDANETPRSSTQPYNVPQNLLNLVASTFPGKTFTYHSIIVKSGDSACLGVNGNEAYGVSYEAMSNLTKGVIGSVCEADYGSQLSNIGKVVVDSIRKVTLQCAPVDLNRDGKADVIVTMADNSTPPPFTVMGMVLEFSQSLPVGSHTLKYTCLKQ